MVTWPEAGTGLTVRCAPVDCEWGEWLPSEPCSVECGGGIQKFSRDISREAMYGGKACSGKFTSTRVGVSSVQW